MAKSPETLDAHIRGVHPEMEISLPCPQCVKEGTKPPYVAASPESFDAHMKEKHLDKTIVTPCKKCIEAGPQACKAVYPAENVASSVTPWYCKPGYTGTSPEALAAHDEQRHNGIPCKLCIAEGRSPVPKVGLLRTSTLRDVVSSTTRSRAK